MSENIPISVIAMRADDYSPDGEADNHFIDDKIFSC